MKDSAKLIVRQSEHSSGFEISRRLCKKFSLPGATRSTSLLTRLLDFKFNPATFEQDFNVWKPSSQDMNGSQGYLCLMVYLQQHLRLIARTLQTYAQVREAILEYHRSRLLMKPVAGQRAGRGAGWGAGCGSGRGAGRGAKRADATFQGGASAPMTLVL